MVQAGCEDQSGDWLDRDGMTDAPAPLTSRFSHDIGHVYYTYTIRIADTSQVQTSTLPWLASA